VAEERTVPSSELRGRGFPALFGHCGLCTGDWSAHRQNFRNRWSKRGRAAFDSSDDGVIMLASRSQRHETILYAEAINQAALAGAKYLMRQGEEIPERPQQQHTLDERWLQVAGPDRRVQFQNAVSEFFNPHYGYLGNTPL
jgi:hypothetical protein